LRCLPVSPLCVRALRLPVGLLLALIWLLRRARLLVRPGRLPLPLTRIWLARRTPRLLLPVGLRRRILRLCLPARILLAVRIPRRRLLTHDSLPGAVLMPRSPVTGDVLKAPEVCTVRKLDAVL
jgi:hypothetical protein